MRRFAFTAAVLACLFAAASCELATAQAPAPDPSLVQLLDHVRRAERLREFNRPLLAKSQLDKAAAIDASARPVLVGYLRLYTRATSGDLPLQDGRQYAEALLKTFPDDYEACFEVASFLFLTAERPATPDPRDVKPALERLEAEMKVFLELADAIITPSAELPESAKGRPRLSLAYLARAAKASPGTEEVAFIAAQELDFRGRSYQTYAASDPAFDVFGRRALELYQRAETLYRRAMKSNARELSVRIALVNLLYRQRKFNEAMREGAAVLRVAPDNLRVVNTLLDVAIAKGDIDLMIENLAARQRLFNDADTAIELSVATRVRDKKWPFQRWRDYRLAASQRGDARLQACGELLKVEPDFLEVHCLAAEELMNRGAAAKDVAGQTAGYEGALKALERTGDLREKLADARRLEAECYWQLGRYKEAAASFAKTAEMDPTDENARFLSRASVAVSSGQCKAADAIDLLEIRLQTRDSGERLKLLKELIQKAPKYAEAILTLAKVLDLQGAYKAALDCYVAVLEIEPENIEGLLGRSLVSMKVGDYAAAAKAFDALLKLRPDLAIAAEALEQAKWVLAGGPNRAKAFDRWLQSRQPAIRPADKERLLEEAIALEPEFFEALLDLGNLLGRRQNPGLDDLSRAEKFLNDAFKFARDDDMRAEARSGLGYVSVRQKAYERAAEHYEASFQLQRGDGTALIFAALARRANGDEAGATVNMRKLVNDLPTSPLVRPKLEDVTRLGLKPVSDAGPRKVSPEYAIGDKAAFKFALEMDGQGGGDDAPPVRVAYGVNLEFVATPTHGGVWKIAMTFADPPASPGYAALADLKLELEISPWFGIIKDPLPPGSELAEVVGPAMQAVAEAFCIGVGDGAIAPPYVWRNDRTAGPPHFGEGAIEGNYIAQMFGDSMEVVRVAAAGRAAGADPDTSDHSRRLETRVEFAGRRQEVRKVSLVIDKRELAKSKDDVLASRLSVTLEAK
ncbi:MAG: tetratricopeptide repeat protein [Planctomycetes bacterium]|nr:tetratricopeptide repeat protein [Planctomycetota bacterium]